MGTISSNLMASGRLREGDLRKMTRILRGGTIGPTTLYYAGVTAPIISAGMSLMAKGALKQAGLDAYWQMLLAAIFAAMAGIVWYLIFIRWSYRQKSSRSSEVAVETIVRLSDDAIHVRRGEVETRIGFSAIQSVERTGKATLIRVNGASAIMIPDHWFKSGQIQHTFITQLEKQIST